MTVLIYNTSITDLSAPASVKTDLNSDGFINISWQPVDDFYLSYYEIHRSEDNSTYNLVANIIFPSTHWIDKGAIEENTYYYKVRGIDKAGVRGIFSDVDLVVNSQKSVNTTTFITGSMTLNLSSLLDREAHSVVIKNLSSKIISITWSRDGVNFDTNTLLSKNEPYNMLDSKYRAKIHTLKISNTAISGTISVHIGAV